MLASVHGVTKSAFTAAFAESEIAAHKGDCVDLDVKHFLVKSLLHLLGIIIYFRTFFVDLNIREVIFPCKLCHLSAKSDFPEQY